MIDDILSQPIGILYDGITHNWTGVQGASRLLINTVAGLKEISCDVRLNEIQKINGAFLEDRFLDSMMPLPKNALIGPCMFPTWDILNSPIWNFFTDFICASQQVVNHFAVLPQTQNKHLHVWPVGINTSIFSADNTHAIKDFLIYYKQRPEEHLQLVESVLTTCGFSYTTVRYGEYTQDDIVQLCGEHRYCVLVIGAETQGIGYMEILSCGLPCIVVQPDNMDYYNRPNLWEYVNTPYFSDDCGVLSHVSNFAIDLELFLSKTYNPRNYIETNHSLKVASYNYLKILDEIHSRNDSECIRYSVIMPYYKREIQLNNTIASFINNQYNKRSDTELIIIEDIKNTEEDNIALDNIIQKYKNEFKIIKSSAGNENNISPEPLINKGVSLASGDFVLLTNPECLHESNVLKTADSLFIQNSDQYLIFSCKNDDNYWYQHSLYNNTRLNFCSILKRELFNKIGGFDERFKDGICYGDNDFVRNIDLHKILSTNIDSINVMHQYHDSVKHVDWQNKLNYNSQLYHNKWLAIDYFINNIQLQKNLIFSFSSKIDNLKNTLNIKDVYIICDQNILKYVNRKYEFISGEKFIAQKSPEDLVIIDTRLLFFSLDIIYHIIWNTKFVGLIGDSIRLNSNWSELLVQDNFTIFENTV